jgi:hypothetical protein
MSIRPDKIDLQYLGEDPENVKAKSRAIAHAGKLGEFYSSNDKGSARSSNRKSQGAVWSGLNKLRMQETPKAIEKPMSHMKVQCLSSKGRNVVVGSLILRFDAEGIAKVEASDREELERIQNARPGRFTILEAPKVVAAPVVAPEPVPVLAPVLTPPVPVSEPAAKPDLKSKFHKKNKKKGALVKGPEN